MLMPDGQLRVGTAGPHVRRPPSASTSEHPHLTKVANDLPWVVNSKDPTPIVQRLRSHTLVASIPYQSTPLASKNYHPEFIPVHKRLGKCVP